MRLPPAAIPYLVAAASIAAAYPLALAIHAALDAAVGDALLSREWRFGSRRAVVFAVAHGWIASLVWALAVWLGLTLLRRWLGAAYGFTALALAVLLLGAAVAGAAPIGLALLVATCVALEAVGRAVTASRRSAPCS